MDEFLKINWRYSDLTELEPQAHSSFISEDVIANSLVYQFFQEKSLLRPSKAKPNIFQIKGYFPGQIKINTFVKSILDEWAHEHCLKALKVFQSGKDPSCYTTSEQFYVDIFNKLKPRILEENSKYQIYVFQQWQNIDKRELLSIKHGLVSFGRNIWETKWKKISSCPQFYNELSMINTTFNENESIIDFKCISSVLDLGTLARFSQPNLKSPCHLNNVTLPGPEDNSVYSNLPVSQDQNIMTILETHHDINLVISSSSLKCITDTSDPKKRWMIPVVVKNITVQKEDEGTFTKNVVFVNKPFSQNDISHLDFAYIGYKRLIKTSFCQFEAFNYGDKDSLLGEEDKVDNKSAFADGNYSFDRPRKRHHNSIHHNASYRIWNIKKTYCHNNLMKTNHKPVEMNVLIRSKLDACECNEQGALQPVILRPKLELQLKYGANVPSKAELAREWTSLFFTPFSNLYRVRLSPQKGEVICVEKCNIQKIIAEAQTHYQYKPQMGLGILQTVFEELIHLKPGNYLLQHLPKHEAFLAVLKETEVGTCKQDVFDFHSEYDKVTLSEFPKNWLPVDANFILPSFEAVNRMPGMFTPKPTEKKFKFKKKKAAKSNSSKQNETKKEQTK